MIEEKGNEIRAGLEIDFPKILWLQVNRINNDFSSNNIAKLEILLSKYIEAEITTKKLEKKDTYKQQMKDLKKECKTAFTKCINIYTTLEGDEAEMYFASAKMKIENYRKKKQYTYQMLLMSRWKLIPENRFQKLDLDD